MNRVTCLLFLWNALACYDLCLAEQKTSLFIKAGFKNGISVQNLTLHNIRSCLGKCTDKCSAIKYNPSTTECRLFEHVLLKWPIEDNVDAEEKMYVKKYPRDVRFQSIAGDTNEFDWYQSRAVCETLGLDLAIIKTDADMVELNTTVTLSKLNLQTSDTTKNKLHIGLSRETAGGNWKWYTGESLDVAWPYWGAGQPDQDAQDNICARIIFEEGFWLNVRDSLCNNRFPIILCE